MIPVYDFFMDIIPSIINLVRYFEHNFGNLYEITIYSGEFENIFKFRNKYEQISYDIDHTDLHIHVVKMKILDISIHFSDLVQGCVLENNKYVYHLISFDSPSSFSGYSHKQSEFCEACCNFRVSELIKS